MKVLILGKGAFGRALYSVVSQNHSDVAFWTRGEVITDADLIIIAVPARAIREVLGMIRMENLPIIVNCSKGVERQTNNLPHQIVQDVLGHNVKYFSLMGPSFSSEVVEKLPTFVNIGHLPDAKPEELALMKDLFQTDYFRVRFTKSIAGIELAGAMKNVYAIAAGVAQGLGLGLNTRSKIVALAVDEVLSLCEGLDFAIDRNAMPAIIGDLVLTCTSSNSRNFKFGTLIVALPVEDSLRQINAVVEGYYTADSVEFFASRAKVSLLLAQLVENLLYGTNQGSVRDRFMHFLHHI